MTVRPLEAGNAHMRRPPRIARIGGTTAGQHYFAPRQGRTDCSSWPQGVFSSHLVAYIWRFNAGFSLQNCGQYSVPWVYKDHKKPPRGHAGGNVTLKACCTLVNRKIPVQKSPTRVAVQLAFSASAFHKTSAAANTRRDAKHLSSILLRATRIRLFYDTKAPLLQSPSPERAPQHHNTQTSTSQHM